MMQPERAMSSVDKGKELQDPLGMDLPPSPPYVMWWWFWFTTGGWCYNWVARAGTDGAQTGWEY